MPNTTENNDEPGFVVAQDGLAPPKADFNAPPPYELRNDMANLMNAQQQQPLQQQQQQQLQQQQMDSTGQLIPVNCKLPTYEEVQMEKSLNAQFLPAYVLHPSQMNTAPPPNPLLPNMHADAAYGRENVTDALQPSRTLAFIAIDATGADTLTNNDSSLLGTDIMFITAFIVAFLFNWIGFLMLTCFCHTIAARYGALSGFGLSLAKWTMIVKHSTELASHKNSWLWWLIMAFGFLICIRALVQYVSIKRTWRLLSASAQERLLFFY